MGQHLQELKTGHVEIGLKIEQVLQCFDIQIEFDLMNQMLQNLGIHHIYLVDLSDDVARMI